MMESEDIEQRKKELKIKIREYQREMKENIKNYNLHHNTVTDLRELYCLNKSKDETQDQAALTFVKLRNARTSMSVIFPLTADLWITWINDEKERVDNIDHKVLKEIFNKATTDYLSIRVWILYTDYLIERNNQGDDEVSEKLIREKFEKGTMDGGLHYKDGGELWDAYIRFETTLLSKLKDQDADGDEYKKQLSRVVKLYRRQISVPLVNHEAHYTKFLDFVKANKEAKQTPAFGMIKLSYDKEIAAKMKDIKAFENTLEFVDGERKKQTYVEYLDYEMKAGGGDPARVQGLFERAVTDFCLDSFIWLYYFDYLENVLKLPDLFLTTFNRAIRNVTWDSRITVRLAIYMERLGHPAAARDAYNEATEVAATDLNEDEQCKVWISYVSFEKRAGLKTNDMMKTYDVIRRALDHLESIATSDKVVMEFVRYWADFEEHRDELGKVLAIWMYFIDVYKTYNVWNTALTFIKRLTDTAMVRKIYKRSIEEVKDNNCQFGRDWLLYENVCGTMDTYTHVEKKLQQQLIDEALALDLLQMKVIKKIPEKELRQRRESLFTVNDFNTDFDTSISGTVSESESESCSEEEESESNEDEVDDDDDEEEEEEEGEEEVNDDKAFIKPGGLGSGKRKIENGEQICNASNKSIGPQMMQSKKIGPQMPSKATASSKEIGPQMPSKATASSKKIGPQMRSKATTSSKEIGPQRSSKATTSFEAKEEPLAKKQKVDNEYEMNNTKTVYVSNLHPNVSGKELVDLFGGPETVVNTRIQQSPRGTFAFVSFATIEDTGKAFKLEHQPLRGRPVYISKYHANKLTRPGANVKYCSELEKTKLFVSNIASSVEEKDLESIFNRLGEMKSIRLIRKKGAGKSFAYVEFNNEEATNKALAETNGRLIKGLTIQVRLSNPNAKRIEKDDEKQTDEKKASPVDAKPSTSTSTATHFIPIQVRKPAPAQRLQIASTSKAGTSKGGERSEGRTPMSNEDFRKLFMKK